MTPDSESVSVVRAFQRLAELVNQLPEEERASLREAFGNYTHDIKDKLGLVSGAAAILSRLYPEEPQISEMTGMIHQASDQIDRCIIMLSDHLNNLIIVRD